MTHPAFAGRAFLCLLAGGCCIAFAPIFVRLSDTGPVASALWRVALAAPMLWLWVWREGSTGSDSNSQSRDPDRNANWSLTPVFLAGVFFAVDLAVWHWSIVWTSVANSTLLANLAPIFVTLGGWILWKEQVTRLFLVGMVTAIVGMFVLVGPNFSAGGTALLGDALGALTAVFYASYMLAIKRSRDVGASTARLMAWSTTISAVLLLPVALLSPQPMLPQAATGWLVLLGLAFVSQVIGQGLIAYAFAHLPASLSSVSLLIQPVVAALAAWALFGEAVGAAQLVGGAIVLAGIWISKRAS
jgi:drug/metabolite transporter (DMT)-like permease